MSDDLHLSLDVPPSGEDDSDIEIDFSVYVRAASAFVSSCSTLAKDSFGVGTK
ncbi:hypothetical protein PM082_003933 [Marasmius tenuissimus]|nr:hypothetical protein PM082_003933 [Marasmius tenuissimus]